MTTFKKLSSEAKKHISPFIRAAIATDIGKGENVFRRGMTGSIACVTSSDVPYFCSDDVKHPIIYVAITKENMHQFHIPSLGLYRQ